MCDIYSLSLHDALPICVKAGMKEDEVRRAVGLPREDWIKQVVQNNRVYSVWIYPKADGGASAIYFDNGVVDRKSTRLNSSHLVISYAVFCLKKKTVV